MWKSMQYTPAQKTGMRDGVNLFFGALIGTNLGSVEDLRITEYALLIVLLAGTVVSLRMFAATDRRWQAYAQLGLYGAVVVHFLFFSKLSTSVDLIDRQKLAVTLAIWTALVLLTELFPSREAPAARANGGTDAPDPFGASDRPAQSGASRP